MKNVTLFISVVICFILNSCRNEVNSESTSNDRSVELIKISQIFDKSRSEYCSNPWSAINGNKVQIMGIKPSKNQYGEYDNNVSDWVFFNKVELVIPPVGKSMARLQIPFSYYSENCWSNPQREGTIFIDFHRSAVDAIIDYSTNVGNDYLTQSKNGDMFEVYLKSPELSIKTPNDACDVTYATFENPSEVFIKIIKNDHKNILSNNSSLSNKFDLDSSRKTTNQSKNTIINNRVNNISNAEKVVDLNSKRIFERLNIAIENDNYDELKDLLRPKINFHGSKDTNIDELIKEMVNYKKRWLVNYNNITSFKFIILNNKNERKYLYKKDYSITRKINNGKTINYLIEGEVVIDVDEGKIVSIIDTKTQKI